MLAENEGTRDGWSHLRSTKENMYMEGDKMLTVPYICSRPLDLFSVLEHLTLQGEADYRGLQTPMPHDFSWNANGGSAYEREGQAMHPLLLPAWPCSGTNCFSLHVVGILAEQPCSCSSLGLNSLSFSSCPQELSSVSHVQSLELAFILAAS